MHKEIQTPGDAIFEEVDEFPAAERLLPQTRCGSNADRMAVCKSMLILSQSRTFASSVNSGDSYSDKNLNISPCV